MAKVKTDPAAVLFSDPDKAARVEQERARLIELFAGVDENKTDFIKNHVQQLAWLNVSILELQIQIDAAGAVIPYDNGGGQRGNQANPACKLLIEYEKLSNTIFRALLPVVPEKADNYDFLSDFKTDPMTEEEKEESYKKQMEELKKIREMYPKE